jgi:hypothetical protein
MMTIDPGHRTWFKWLLLGRGRAACGNSGDDQTIISGTTIIITKVKAAQQGDLILSLEPQQRNNGNLGHCY